RSDVPCLYLKNFSFDLLPDAANRDLYPSNRRLFWGTTISELVESPIRRIKRTYAKNPKRHGRPERDTQISPVHTNINLKKASIESGVAVGDSKKADSEMSYHTYSCGIAIEKGNGN
ncbi:hypothetical protein STAS_14600, partial [Striga asiatica]